MSLLISNRRYTGSKASLLEKIYESIEPFSNKKVLFADLFAGTGVVASYMLEKGMDVIVNDTLQSNTVAYEAWLGTGRYSTGKLEKIVEKFNAINSRKLKENYFSEVYGGKYFSKSDAKKIGYIRDCIEKEKLTKRERYILLSSLMYTVDKIANTVGHFEHFLSKPPLDKGVILRLPKLQEFKGRAFIYNMDANMLVKKITCDIAYIDPPYNARQYINFYHVLENLVRWNKPKEFEGNSMKFKREELKSDYSRAKAPQVFKSLIDNLQAKVIIVSYNNTYTAKSSASNNKITEDQLMKILSSKGRVTKREIEHRFFNSGKTNFNNHKELLYICKTNL